MIDKEKDSRFVAYYGHHKCGTTWISHVVSAICQKVNLKYNLQWNDQLFGKDIDSNWKNDNFDFLCYTNADYIQIRHLKIKSFHVIRDPRDLIVSSYYSHLKSHPDNWPRIYYFRKYLQSLPKEIGIMKEIEYSLANYQHLLMWDYNNPYIKELKFEKLTLNPKKYWLEILKFIGLYPDKIKKDEIYEILRCYSFERMSGGRKPGEEDQTHHFRKGVSGDWRNHFTSQHIDYFKKLYNPILLKTGYETSEDWC